MWDSSVSRISLRVPVSLLVLGALGAVGIPAFLARNKRTALSETEAAVLGK